jgi:hypothetical protein
MSKVRLPSSDTEDALSLALRKFTDLHSRLPTPRELITFFDQTSGLPTLSWMDPDLTERLFAKVKERYGLPDEGALPDDPSWEINRLRPPLR